MKRSSGILLPIFSLPSKYGIGSLGKEAYNFIDFLHSSLQTYWQILPIMETGSSNSPYSTISNFAGNPFFIDLDLLKDNGLLDEQDYMNIDFGNDENRVIYNKLYENRFKVLKIASKNFRKKYPVIYKIFKIKYNYFLQNYSLFHALKDYYNGACFNTWDDKYKFNDRNSILEFKKEHYDDIEFYKTIQCIFYIQWFKLKKYANSKGIKIIGDTPIYSDYDSAEVWSMPYIFNLDENKNPIEVSGCPPDAYSIKGQLWGNPLYNYEYIEKNNFKYFINKYYNLGKLYDVIRIDHFRGFESYYAIPYKSVDATNGHWVKAPGIKLFDALKSKLKNKEIIVEDLGVLTEQVYELLHYTGFPGMKVLQFAFNADNKSYTNYLPHTYEENSVAYIGTHDNDTFVGWINSLNNNDKLYATEYMNLKNDSKDNYRAISMVCESKSNLAIITPQDLLNIGSEGRLNTPSTVNCNNWSFRLRKGQLDDNVKNFLRDITIKTNRA